MAGTGTGAGSVRSPPPLVGTTFLIELPVRELLAHESISQSILSTRNVRILPGGYGCSHIGENAWSDENSTSERYNAAASAITGGMGGHARSHSNIQYSHSVDTKLSSAERQQHSTVSVPNQGSAQSQSHHSHTQSNQITPPGGGGWSIGDSGLGGGSSTGGAENTSFTPYAETSVQSHQNALQQTIHQAAHNNFDHQQQNSSGTSTPVRGSTTTGGRSVPIPICSDPIPNPWKQQQQQQQQ